tara:strand:- start:13530 stop:13703 length:174 start_codon:yes stop_codon:yes gene_type:complete
MVEDDCLQFLKELSDISNKYKILICDNQLSRLDDKIAYGTRDIMADELFNPVIFIHY